MAKETVKIMANKLIDLLQQSVIVQGALTLGVVGVWLYLHATGHPIPDGLNQIVGLVVGFYFGGKSLLQAQKIQKV